MKHLKVGVVSILLVVPGLLTAERVTVSCSNIADPTERLACFDRTFPRDLDVAPVDPGAGPIESNPVVAPVPSATQTPTPAAAPAAQEPAKPPARGGIFSSREPVSISSRLKSVRDKDKQKMVFLLENDQIWLQDSPRSLPFNQGDEVTVKSAKVGGYMLSNGKGVSTRVRRIK